MMESQTVKVAQPGFDDSNSGVSVLRAGRESLLIHPFTSDESPDREMSRFVLNRALRQPKPFPRAIGTSPCVLLLSALLVLASLSSSRAVPAAPDGIETAQPDGTRVIIHGRGDEYFAWNETPEGYVAVRDLADGFWKYALPATNQAAFRALANARVGTVSPAALGLRPHTLPDAQLMRRLLRSRRAAAKGKPVDLAAATNTSSKTQTTNPTETVPPSLPRSISVSGVKSIKNIVILACFSNHWDAVAGTVSNSFGRASATEYSDLFNQVGYAADGAVGSVRDYYTEVSYGKLTMQSVIVPWVQLPQSESYYGAGEPDPHPQQMVADAINAASAAGFDFSQGDSDGDGWVDGLTIIHSSYGQEYGNPSPDTRIWSHQWNLTSIVTKNSTKLYHYHTEPAFRGGSGTSITRIGVICHEMGHFFGLPDLYDYSSSTEGLGDWSIMASGSWNGSDGKRPAHFDAWSKCFLGFVNPVPVHSQSGLQVPRVEDNAVVKMLRDGTSNGEYFLVENRAKVGFDNDPTIYPGLLIYHVDSKSGDNDLGSWPHPVVKIEEADGDNSLGNQTAASELGDVWTSTSGLAGGFRDQSGNLSANAMLYQSAHYCNRSNLTAYYTYNTLNSFSAAASNMSCNVLTLKTTPVSQTTNSSTYLVTWPASAQATQYELEEGSPATISNFSDGAESADAMYDNWYVAGTVKQDSTSKHGGTYCYSMNQYYGGDWGSAIQSLTLRASFKVTSSTVISFYLLSHLSAGNGSLKCQISNDGGNTWKTLGSYDGNINNWPLRSYDYTAISAQGIGAGDSCIVRFIANYEYTSGWSTFPGYGYALDDISITGAEIPGYTGWATLANNISTTNYTVTGKTSGTYAYRIRAFANSAWQSYGDPGETIVNILAAPPAITTQPQTQMVNQGSTVTFTVTASGATPFSYQWRSNATDIASATANQLTLNAVQPAYAANYTVVVTNSLGAVTSAVATLTVNIAPVLPAQSARTNAELTTLTVTNTATDANTAASNLTYSLLAAPTGAVISTNGVITWTPTEAQGPSTNTFTSQVADNGTPPLTATNSFAVIVTEVNQSPALTAISNRTIVELRALTITNMATDSDIPTNALTFSMLNAPTNATLNPASGVFSWTPNEAQGPGTNTFSIVVSDNGSPSMSATQLVTVVVLESNSPPILAAIPNATMVAGDTLLVQAAATDSDLPANALSYSLDASAPSNATINATSGLLSWPTETTDTGAPHTLTIRVTDNGVPPLDDAQTFVVNVVPPTITIRSLTLSNSTLIATWNSISGRLYQLQYKAALESTGWTTNPSALTATGSTATLEISLPEPKQFFRIRAP